MAQPAELAPRVVEFCRLLREQGLGATPSHTLAAVGALRLVDVGDREDFRLALRAVLARGPSELEVFDRTFRVFWEGRLDARQLGAEEQAAAAPADASLRWSDYEALRSEEHTSELQ